MDGPQTWSQMNDTCRHRNHLVVANAVASVLLHWYRYQILQFWPTQEKHWRIENLRSVYWACFRWATRGRCSDAVAHLHDKQYQRWSFHLTSRGPQNPWRSRWSSWNDRRCSINKYLKIIIQSPLLWRWGWPWVCALWFFSIYIGLADLFVSIFYIWIPWRCLEEAISNRWAPANPCGWWYGNLLSSKSPWGIVEILDVRRKPSRLKL